MTHLIEITRDDSRTLRHPDHAETYHSTFGAVTESRHVFIDRSGFALSLHSADRRIVLEFGLGTGLNFLLAADAAITNGVQLSYTAVESRQVDSQTVRLLEYQQWLRTPGLAMRYCQWLDGATDQIDPLLSLEIVANWTDLTTPGSGNVDFVFHDAFSPANNPDGWTSELLQFESRQLKSGGIFVTYAARRDLSNKLQLAGLQARRIPGPPGKRQMTIAIKK